MIKPLIVHNFYQQAGGEDQVFAAESALLESRGHTVVQYTVRNDEVDQYGDIQLARAAIWNGSTYRKIRKLIQLERPDIVHCHNTLPLISPSVYYAARHENIPVVQTLHNYRLVCPSALLFRDGVVCELCLKRKLSWPGVVHACYRDSRPATAVVAAMTSMHSAMRTWREKISAYIVLSDFARQKFIEGGLPSDRLFVKPNFLSSDPGVGEGGEKYMLFVGRLSPEKGVEPLLQAWQRHKPGIQLKILGDGPMASDLARSCPDGVEWLGRRPRGEVLQLMKHAYALVMPSLCYEGFPVTLVEAYAVGLPVIASNLGSLSSLVAHGRTGLHFKASDPADLARQVDWAMHHKESMGHMRKEARAEYENQYTAGCNYPQLVTIYKKALQLDRQDHPSRSVATEAPFQE